MARIMFSNWNNTGTPASSAGDLRFSLGIRIFLTLSIISICLGCQPNDSGSGTSAITVQAASENSSHPISKTTTSTQSPENTNPQQPTSETNGGKIASAKKWMQDALGGAAETSSQSASASLDWANKTFQSLKDQGLTTAKDTSDWLAQDWNNMESWQYTIISIDGNANEATVEKLNQMGAQGWECFHIDGKNYFFKKPSESYLRRLPFKDMIRLLPLLDQSKK